MTGRRSAPDLVRKRRDRLAQRRQLLGDRVALAQEGAALGHRRFDLGKLEEAVVHTVALDIEAEGIGAEIREGVVHILVDTSELGSGLTPTGSLSRTSRAGCVGSVLLESHPRCAEPLLHSISMGGRRQAVYGPPRGYSVHTRELVPRPAVRDEQQGQRRDVDADTETASSANFLFCDVQA